MWFWHVPEESPVRYLRKLFLPIVYNGLFATIFCVTRKIVHIATKIHVSHCSISLFIFRNPFLHCLWQKIPGLFVHLHFRSREQKDHRENFRSRGTFAPVERIRYDSEYLTCSKKPTGSQLSLPHGTCCAIFELLEVE